MKNNPDIIWLDVAESSNDEARRAIDSLDNLSVVAVRCQTSGRGQGTHTWESAPGENLTFSVVLKEPGIFPNEQIAISHTAALAVVELLGRLGIEARIKLPNDIYVGTKKICGILIENSLYSNRIQWSIIGIGINVNQTVFPTSLPNPTSVATEHNQESWLDLHQLLLDFYEIYSQYYRRYLGCRNESNLEALDQLFSSILLGL